MQKGCFLCFRIKLFPQACTNVFFFLSAIPNYMHYFLSTLYNRHSRAYFPFYQARKYRTRKKGKKEVERKRRQFEYFSSKIPSEMFEGGRTKKGQKLYISSKYIVLKDNFKYMHVTPSVYRRKTKKDVVWVSPILK